MKKEFIRDDGKVRGCISNIAKMNVVEWIYYRRDMLFRSVVDTGETFVEGCAMVGFAILNFVILILSPITLPIIAWWQIRQAKKEMDLVEHREKSFWHDMV